MFRERRGRARIGMAQLGAGETGRAHLLQDRVERHVAGELVEVIVAPDDRIGADETVVELYPLRGSRGGRRGHWGTTGAGGRLRAKAERERARRPRVNNENAVFSGHGRTQHAQRGRPGLSTWPTPGRPTTNIRAGAPRPAPRRRLL